VNGYRFDENGELIKSNVFIVWGSPASGKTTHVRNNMKNGDLIIDLDLIKQAISMQEKTEAPDNLLNIAISIRETLYNIVEKKEFNCDNVWIVASLPKHEDREKLRQRLNAELIHIDTDKNECIRRAHKDNERKDKEKQEKLINKWFKAYYYEE
jgi:predicted kinase